MELTHPAEQLEISVGRSAGVSSRGSNQKNVGHFGSYCPAQFAAPYVHTDLVLEGFLVLKDFQRR